MKTFSQFVEDIKGWKHAGSDIAAARRAASAEKDTVHLHNLRADGEESGMHDARTGFRTEADADAHIENRKKLNPGRKFRYNKYVNGKHIGVVQ